MNRLICTLTLFGIALSGMMLSAKENAVSGVVRLDGPRPKRQPIRLNTESRKLYKTAPLKEDRLVSAKGGIANVFVYVKQGLKDKSYPAPKKSIVLNQDKSMFRPRVQGVQVGQEFLMRNSDPFIHNVRSLSSENRPFNIAQPAKTPDRKKVFTAKEGPIRIQCDFHPWMTAYIFAMEHPYFAVTDAQGRFTIKGLPAGSYTLAIWHEAFGEQEQKITVKASGLKGIKFEFKPAKP